MDALPFAKVVRVKSRRLLASYAAEHPTCEVQGCGRVGQIHHLSPRGRGQEDRHFNLLTLCGGHHTSLEAGWHGLGARTWYERFKPRLSAEAREKIERVLRIDSAEAEAS